MKIAILSDIHGNSAALKSVLNEINALHIQKLIVLGDFVGYYYYPDEVLSLLSSWDYEFIRGNHEMMLEKSLASTAYKEVVYQKYGSGVNMAINKLTANQLSSLINADERKVLSVGQQQVLLCHGSPWDTDEYIYPDAERSVFERCFNEHPGITLSGHTHRPFVKSVGENCFVNPGSVGQSRVKGGVANWAILDGENGSTQLMETLYDITALVDAAREIDPHVPYLHEVLMR